MNRTLLTTIAALAILAATPALAAPRLKASVVVASAVVTVGDMFDDAGLIAEKGLFRAPAPGTAGSVPLADITAAASRIGLTDFDSAGLTAVSVARSGVQVDEAMLSTLIARDLTIRGILTDGTTLDTAFATTLPALMAADTAEPVKLIALRYMPGSESFSASFSVSGSDKPLDVTGRITLMIEVPHLAANLAAGTVLSAADIEMRRVPLQYAESSGYLATADIIGKALQRQSRAGMMLKASDIAPPQLISRNDAVTVYYHSGPMTLTVKGQALNAASLGEPVSVMSALSKKMITGTATASGTVEIKSGPFAVAGL